MPDSRDFDVTWLSNLRLPYDVVTKELSDQQPRLVAGSQNIYVTLGGKIALAPGFTQTPNGANLVPGNLPDSTFRPDRMVIYETLESPPKIYIVVSFFIPSAGIWQIRYYRVDSAASPWAEVDNALNFRSLDNSTRPHEMVCDRGLCFIKGFPNSSGDKYGSVIFDGSIPNPGSNSTPSFYPWGTIPPTIAVNMTAQGGWTASTDPVTVTFGWTYVYCWKDLLGHYSCHSPVSLVTAINQSNTGAFTNKVPNMNVQGNADTVNYPKIGIFRSTDGGGTYWFVEDITNTGAGNISYTDQHGVGGRTDPFADSQLNTANAAPDLVTNLPPPPVMGKVGEITGTSQVDPSTSIAVFGRRLWYGSGNRLFFSGQEEVLNGVPEECWPNCNGIGPADQYICTGQVRQVFTSKSTLWVTTSGMIHYETGTDLSNFLLNDLVSDISGLAGNNMAGTGFREMGFFVSQDFHVYMLVAGMEPQNISIPLGNSIATAYNACTTPQIQLEVYNRDGNTWLLVLVIDQATNPINCKQFVYDLNNNMWFAPWTKQLGLCAYGRLRDNDQLNYLVGWIHASGNWQLAVLDTTIFTDVSNTITPTIQTNLFGLASGWGAHSSLINAPAVTPVVSYMVTERTKFISDTDPTVSFRLDDFNTVAFTSVVPAPTPLFEAQRTSYWQQFYPIQQACRRVQLNITKSAVNEGFEYQNIGFVWFPGAGA